jgi:hypothetical protein
MIDSHHGLVNACTIPLSLAPQHRLALADKAPESHSQI